MIRSVRVALFLASCLVLSAAAASAQTNAVITGVVRDATGAVLPGVTVEASSPALIEKSRSAITDETGQYKILELRPGIYTVQFSLQGFSTVRREGIELTTGFTASINGELRVGAIEETVTVSGASPVVDLQNVKTQVVMTRDIVDSIPTGKYFQNLAVLIPGVVASRGFSATANQDVGGQGGQSHSSLAIHGGRPNDMEIQLDGMNTSSWNRSDSSIVLFVDGNIGEYAIEVSGKSAEAETGGVRINMIPREGSNAFKGSFFSNFSNPSLQTDNVSDDLRQRGLPVANTLKRMWSVNPTLGGPILRNRVWFFGSYTHNVSDNYVGGLFYNANPAAWTYTPDTNRQGYLDLTADDAAIRTTWQASQRNKIAIYYDYNDNCNCHFLVGPTVAPEAGVVSTGKINVLQATWTSPVTNKFLLEAGFSTLPQDKAYSPDPSAVAAPITDQSSNLLYRARNNLYRKEDFQNRTLRASGSYVTGGHAAKIGFTAVFGTTDVIYYDPFENILYRVINGRTNATPNRVTYYGLPTRAQDYLRPNLGVYAQDQWTIRRMTINAGLRFDYLRTGYPDHDIPATKYVPVPRVFAGEDVIKWTSFSPRLGASYDLFGTGKTAVKFSAGHFVLADGLPSRRPINPVVQNNSMNRTWQDLNGDFIVQGDPFNPATNGELGPSDNLSFGRAVRNAFYDEEWAKGFNTRPYNWEMSAGVQHELLPRVSVGASYFKRLYGNFEMTDNLAIAGSDYDEYCVTSPSDLRLPNGGSERICGLYDLKREKLGQVNTITRSSSSYGKRTEHWNGYDLSTNARLGRGAILQGGLSSGRTTADECDIAPRVDNPSQRFCHTQGRFLTQFKLLGAYTLPWQIQVAGTFQSIPGPEISANWVASNAQIAPSLGRNLSSCPAATGACTSTVTLNLIEPRTLYGERMNQLDFRFAKIFTVNRMRLQGSMDLYNAFNQNSVLQLNTTYGTNGASWLVPQAILNGRLMKFDLQLNF
jgi:hypothetical protein